VYIPGLYHPGRRRASYTGLYYPGRLRASYTRGYTTQGGLEPYIPGYTTQGGETQRGASYLHSIRFGTDEAQTGLSLSYPFHCWATPRTSTILNFMTFMNGTGARDRVYHTVDHHPFHCWTVRIPALFSRFCPFVSLLVCP